MVEKRIRGGICHAIHRYAKANNKYMKNYDKDMESSYLEYLDANNLCGCAVSKKRLVNGFEWEEDLSQFKEDFIKNYDEADVEYPKKLFNLHSDLSFLSERNNIKKCNKLVCDVYDKEDYVVHIKTLKQALNHQLILKKCTE